MYQLFYGSEKYTALKTIEKSSGDLKIFIDNLVDPDDGDYNSVMLIGQDGSVSVVGKNDVGSQGNGKICLYSTANVAIDFDDVELAENEVGSIKGTIDSFSPKEKGNFKRFSDVNFKIKVSGSDDVKGFATLMAINTYLEAIGEDGDGDVGAAVLEASQKYRNIVTSSICKKTKEEFEKDYETVSGINKDKYPGDKKVEAVKFVLLVQNFYNAVDGLKQNFTTPDDERVEAVLEAAFGLDPFSKFIGFSAGNVASTHLAFLMKALGGNVGVQKTKPKANPGPGSGKSGPGQPGQPGEKKGFSTGAKVAMGITIPAAVLAATGVALWKTGYGAKIWGKIKTLMNKDGNRRPDIKFNSQGKEPVVKN